VTTRIDFSLKELAVALDSEVSGHQIRAPGPGHSARDRSVVFTPSDDVPGGFVAYFKGDDWLACRNRVRHRLRLMPWQPQGRKLDTQDRPGPLVAEQPLIRVRYLTARPSMPPGSVYADLLQAGKRPSGGKQDFCWLIFEKAHRGSWGGYRLHRDGDGA
jgi:hypothetical protein